MDDQLFSDCALISYFILQAKHPELDTLELCKLAVEEAEKICKELDQESDFDRGLF